MSNPKNKITPEGIKQMKEKMVEILQAICYHDKINIVNFQKGQIYKTE